METAKDAPETPEKDLEPQSLCKFAQLGLNIMRGQETIAQARSVTMARRIVNALNSYIPNRKGV